MKLRSNLFIFTLLALILPLLSSPDSSAASSDDAELPRKERKKTGLTLTFPTQTYECLCSCCKSYIPERDFSKHIRMCAWKKLEESIVTKPAPIAPKSITIPAIDLSCPEQSSPTTPAMEIAQINNMLKRAEPESVFTAIDAKNRYPLKKAPYLVIVRELLTESETLKRPCPEPAATEE